MSMKVDKNYEVGIPELCKDESRVINTLQAGFPIKEIEYLTKNKLAELLSEIQTQSSTPIRHICLTTARGGLGHKEFLRVFKESLENSSN